MEAVLRGNRVERRVWPQGTADDSLKLWVKRRKGFSGKLEERRTAMTGSIGSKSGHVRKLGLGIKVFSYSVRQGPSQHPGGEAGRSVRSSPARAIE